MSAIKLLSIPRKALWGRNKLKEHYHYDFYPDGVGQCWQFAIQKDKSNAVITGEYVGETLQILWEKHPELFASRYEKFPFIIGLVGPSDSLSIQVHPDGAYAKARGMPSGKNEAWYFADCEPGADLILGCNAGNRAELESYVRENRYEELIRRREVREGDFVYVPAGTVHAMQKGVIAYEVQEQTDITYRLYDFDRVGPDGKKRDLDVQECLECIQYNDVSTATPAPVVTEYPHCTQTEYINNECFRIVKLDVAGEATYRYTGYLLMTVMKGSCEIDGVPCLAGESVLVPATGSEVTLNGNAQIMYTTEGCPSK